MESQAITGELGPKQHEAANGPIDQNEPEMLTYECKGCGGRFADLGLYFYGTSSTKCIWCSKFPKAKNVRTIKTVSD
jgi:hypothetical protein